MNGQYFRGILGLCVHVRNNGVHSLLLQSLFPWSCVGYELDAVRSHPTFARSMARPTEVLLSLINYFRWANVGIIASSDDIWVETATKV